MSKHEDLLLHFSSEHASKVFFQRLSLTNGNPGIMYLYNTVNELQYFKESFVAYLPLYIFNEDLIESIDISGDINSKIEIYSKRIWQDSKTMPHRKINVNGIYGELFLDIYLNVVSGIKPLISFASKRSFNSNNESKGIDSIGYVLKDDQIELYFSEAKFVTDKYSTKSELLDDIKNGHSYQNGEIVTFTEAHLTKKYLDDYCGFVLEKDITCSKEDRQKIRLFYNAINEGINSITKPQKFTDLVIELNVRINFVCFAIFNATERHPDDLSTMYDDLIDAIQQQFITLGISNYSAEVVFIPTNNPSMIIKKEIASFYE